MLPKSVIDDISRYEQRVKLKKERISKLKRLAKLATNSDLVAEYDAIIKQSEDTIWATLDSKDLMDAHKEQTILHACAKTRLMAKGLKASLCESEKQVELLNESIEDDNIKIEQLKNAKTHGGKYT